MNLAQALIIFLYLAATFINIGFIFIAWQRRPVVWATPLACLMLATAQWSLSAAFALNTPLLEGKLFWHNLQYIGSSTTPVFFLLFAHACYSQPKWQKRYYLPLFIVPLATLFFAWTNLGDIFWRQLTLDATPPIPTLLLAPGIWYGVHLLYSAILLLIGTFFLGHAAYQRQQFTMIFVGLAIVWASSILSVTAVLPFNLTPVSFTPMALLFGLALHRLHFFELPILTRHEVVNQMSNGVIVLGQQGQIVDVNEAFARVIGRSHLAILGQTITTFLPELTWIYDYADEAVIRSELSVGEEIYELQLSAIFDQGRLAGHLLILNTITIRKRIEAELLSQKHLLQNLVLVARATTSSQSLGATLQNILDVAVAINQAEYGSLFVLNERGEIAHSILTQDKKLPLNQQQTINQQVLEKGLFGWVFQHGKLALIGDTEQDGRWLKLPGRSQTVRSTLAVPILEKSRVIGVLTLTHSQPGHFNEEQAMLMQGAADQMALALRNAQLYDAQKRMAEREHILYQVLRTIGERMDEQWIIQTAVESISAFTGWPGVVILMAQNLELAVAAVTDRRGQLNENHLASGLNANAFASGKTEKLIGWDVDSQDLPPGFQNGIAIPLHQGDKTIGILSFYSDKLDGLDQNDVQLGEALAEAIALSIENARLHANVRKNVADLNALISSSRDGLIYIGLDKKIYVINEMTLRLLGLNQDVEQWLNQSIQRIFMALHTQIGPLLPSSEYQPEKEISILEAEIDLMQKGDEPAAEGELNLPSRTIQWLSLPLISEGEALGRLLILRDVTEERLLARMREDLTHMTVHDLRNPLSSQSMAIELLEAEVPEEVRPFVEIMDINNKKMLTLVNNLLDISRLENHQMPLHYEYVPVAQLVETTLLQQQALANDKGIHLETQIADAIAHAWIDRPLVERVFQNLLGNAVKFTHHEGVIRVTADTDPQSYGEWLIFFIYNSGEGIPLDLQERIFDKFTTGNQDGRGSGLGLAFCKMVVEAHGGRIWVESTPGQDATFIFTLPAA